MYRSRFSSPPNYYSPRLMGIIAMFFLAGVLVLNIVALWATLLERDMLHTIINQPVAVKFSDVEANNSRLFTIRVAQYVMLLPTMVALVGWMYRTYKNLFAWGTVGLRYRPFWAWLGFFVPIVNFFHLYQIAADIWKASDPDTDHSQPQQWRKGSVDSIIGLWWASLILIPLFDHFTSHQLLVFGKNSSVSAYLNANFYALVGTCFTIMALMVAIVFVYRLSARQDQKFDQLTNHHFPFDPPPDAGLESNDSERRPIPREQSLVLDMGTAG